jgi:colicin import membrane protein
VEKKFAYALFLSLVLHAVVALLMGLGDFTSTPKPTPQALAMQAKVVKPIEAVAIDKKKFQQQVDKIRQKKSAAKAAEVKRIKALEKRAAKAKKSRKKEQDKIRKLERARKIKEKEKRKADKAAKTAKAKAAVAEKDRKNKEALKRKADKAADDARARRIKEEKAEQLRKKKTAERKRKEQEAREKAMQEQLLEQQLAQEMATRKQARRQQMMTEIQRYTALISQSIQRNLITDKSSMAGKSCKLTISLAPSGFVTNVVKGAGDRIVCDAAQKAVYKAGTLPVSKDAEVFKEMRTISLTVVPEFNE